MRLHNAVREAYRRKWSYINNFEVYLNWTGGSVSGTTPASIAGFNSGQDISLNVKSISTPQFTNDAIEFYQCGKWRIQNGRPNLYSFNITFLDEDQLKLYRQFIVMYLAQQSMYFDDAKFTTKIVKCADYLNESDKTLFDFADCLISSIGPVNFSNETEAQIAEFEVEIKSTTPLIVPHAGISSSILNLSGAGGF